MRLVARCYRAHDPRWSFSPLSGQGAAITGGRFNRKGQAALYLSLDPVTAMIEATQGFATRLNPLLLCEYDVDCAEIADLRSNDARTTLGVTLGSLAVPWLIAQRAGKVARSQQVAASLRDQGFVGALVPSFAPGVAESDYNLVLWKWGPDLPEQVTVYDPQG